MSARILTVVQRNTKNTNQHQDALEPRAQKKTDQRHMVYSPV
jgi:hypothetical protein